MEIIILIDGRKYKVMNHDSFVLIDRGEYQELVSGMTRVVVEKMEDSIRDNEEPADIEDIEEDIYNVNGDFT